MSTRDDQVEACRKAACWDEVENPSPTAAVLHHAAATLTRDGEMRERLAAYADELATSGDPEEAETKRAIGAALKALLKETSDEG